MAKIDVKCPQCGSGWIVDGKRCRKCGYRGEREDFINQVEDPKPAVEGEGVELE